MTAQNELNAYSSALENNKNKTEFKVYRRRWVVLFIFVLYSISNLVQYIEFSIIADVMVDYYQVSYEAVDWSAMIAALTYVVVSVPGTYMIDKIGVRKTIIIGILGTVVGSWIKVGSVHPDRFWLVIFGQGIVSSFQICIFPLLPKLAATWFGYDQISTAIGLGFIGTQVGCALSYIIPPLIVWKGEVEDVERRLYILNILYASFSTAIIPLIIIFFSDAPPTPPSIAQTHVLKEKNVKSKNLIEICKSIMTIKPYILYLIIEAINIGILCPFQVLSNQIILYYYPTATYDVGVIGLLQMFLSLIGSMGASIVMDRFKKYKITCWVVYFTFLLSVAFYVGTIDLGIGFVYVSSILLGIGMGAMLTLGIELIVEFTYPEPESVSVGLLMNVAQASSIGFTFLYGYIFRTVSILWANLTMLLLTIAVDFLFFFLKFDLRRKAIQDSNGSK